MYKLDIEKAEEPEIKLATSVGLKRKPGNSRKTSIPVSSTMLKPLTVWITTNRKISKEMEIPDNLTCFLRNLRTGQEATVRTGHRRIDWFKIRKRICQSCILSSCLFNLYTEYIMQNTGMDEAQTGTKTARRNINNVRYADDTTPTLESE